MKNLQISENESRDRDNLFRLMRENPDLPVIPFVDGEVCAGDDFASWMGSWGASRVDEFVFPPDEYKPVIFKSDDDVFDMGNYEGASPEQEYNSCSRVK